MQSDVILPRFTEQIRSDFMPPQAGGGGGYSSVFQESLIDKLNDMGLQKSWSEPLFEHIDFFQWGLSVFLLVVCCFLFVKYRCNVTKLESSYLFLSQREFAHEENYSKRETIALYKGVLLERERIYQDIHDGIGSQLVKAIFSLRSNKSDSRTVINMLQSCLQDLRPVIDAQPESNVDIQTTVSGFCETQEFHLKGSGINISCQVGLESTVYEDSKVRLNVQRVLQESFSNMLKHSGATHIAIKLDLIDSHLVLTITDNGYGDRGVAFQALEQKSHFGPSGNRGIKGLGLRAADIGAEYSIHITESGTKVCLSIPVPVPAPGMNIDEYQPALGMK